MRERGVQLQYRFVAQGQRGGELNNPLFDWLAGRATQVSGWKADLGAISSGRLVVSRVSPSPTVLLQVQLSP